MKNDFQLIDMDCGELIESLPAAIYICDHAGKITFYNQAAAELWGREPEIGKDMWCGSWKIYHTDGSPMELNACPMALTLRNTSPVRGAEIIVERPDGVKKNILPYPKPLFDVNGQLTGAINMLVDITEKREREQLLRKNGIKYRNLSESLTEKNNERSIKLEKSEERYHKMIEEVKDYAILLLDSDGTILNWNMGAEKIKGYTEKEIIGKNFKIFYRDEDQKQMLPEQLIAEARENGRAMHEGWRLRKDGTMFWGNIVITALHGNNNEVIGFSKVTRDLTEKKIVEDQLKEYAKNIEFKNSQLEEYVYIASHDLQEPLRKIQTFTELLTRDLDNREMIEKNIEKIRASARRMTILVNEVLNYSQLTQSDELFSSIDLNQVLENVKEDFELLIKERNVKIVHGNLPVILGVPIQLHQLFSNLIGNGIKFSETNPLIEITSEQVSGDTVKIYPELNPDRNYLKLGFKDSGVGIEPKYADQIFKMFQRLHNKQSGTGIGLALCKRIAENHHGHIMVNTESGKGSTFYVFIPF